MTAELKSPPQAHLLAQLIATGEPYTTDTLMPDGERPRITTGAALYRNGWLVGVEVDGRQVGVVTPAGRLALREYEPGLDTGWSDEDRVRMRTEVAGRGRSAFVRCLGPLEAEACAEHPDQLEVYRCTWTAPPGGDLAGHLAALDRGRMETVRPCPACAMDTRAEIANATARAAW